MSLPVFWMDGDPLRGGDQLVLDGAEGRHAAVVRRIRSGEAVEITDGRGHVARCVVTEAGPSGLTCDVRDRRVVTRPEPQITVIQALAKGERAELAVELMTELGVDVIVPWQAQRSVVQWKGERIAKGLHRWRSTAFEAAKQSRRTWFPEVDDPVTTGDAARRIGESMLGVVLHESADVPVAALDVPQSGKIVLVVGPEGGIDDAELAAFVAARATLARLGPTVLRTSTAGAIAAGVLLSQSARWK